MYLWLCSYSHSHSYSKSSQIMRNPSLRHNHYLAQARSQISQMMDVLNKQVCVCTIQYHPTPSNTIQHHLTPFNTIQHHPIPSNTIQYHPTPSNTIQYHPIPSNTIQYHPTPSNCDNVTVPIITITSQQKPNSWLRTTTNFTANFVWRTRQ